MTTSKHARFLLRRIKQWQANKHEADRKSAEYAEKIARHTVELDRLQRDSGWAGIHSRPATNPRTRKKEH